jgi:outer membrane lipoprotein-sorting protein
MKKLFAVCMMALCTSFVLNAEVNKEEFFTRISQKYEGLQEISGKYEINMPMMGSIMKIPASFWKKGDKMRMDMTISQPGMPKPMEQSVLMDGEKITQYQKAFNTVMTIDLNKLPPEMKAQMKKQQMFMMDAGTMNNYKNMLDSVDVEEKVRDGKNFYLVTVKDIDKTGGMFSMPGGQQSPQQMFKKSLMWIHRDSLLPGKMELYGEGDTPGIWIDFLDLKTDSIPASIFKLAIPADAKTMDITDMVKNMSESMK